MDNCLVCRSICSCIPDRIECLLFCVDDCLHTRQNTMLVILCGWRSAYQTEYNACYSVWMTVCIPDRIQCLLFCVDDCLHTRQNTILVILCGWLSAYRQNTMLVILCRWLSGVQEHMLMHTRQNTMLAIPCGWLSGMQEHMLLHTRQNTILVILCGWLSGRQGGIPRVEIDKCTKNKLCTKLALFTRLPCTSYFFVKLLSFLSTVEQPTYQ